MTGKQRLPLWISNLVVFGLLFAAVMMYFLWQSVQARRAFTEHVDEHAQLVAEVIQLNARGAVFSRSMVEEILLTFLGNTARFIEYLDSVESFTEEELSAFSAEQGLAGIAVSRDTGRDVSGPEGWTASAFPACTAEPALHHMPATHQYLLAWPRQDRQGCIIVGLEASGIELLEKNLSIGHLTETLSKLPGICYAHIENAVQPSEPAEQMRDVCIQVTQDFPVAEVRLRAGSDELVVGLCADYLTATLHQVWRDFFIFSAFLAVMGGLLSFVLYRLQKSHLEQVRDYERQIAQEGQDGALGRAAASIAHEIRNPLNTIKMGLQRMQLEGGLEHPDHRHLVGLMLDAVRRANGTVSGLMRYTSRQEPNMQPVALSTLVSDVLSMYEPRCREQRIRTSVSMLFHGTVQGDPDMLHQAFENLFNNAVEAQPSGGFISVELSAAPQEVSLCICNAGCVISPAELGSMLDPYFTTKTDGTGLGLSIVRRIAEAHGGRIVVESRGGDRVAVMFVLPRS